MQPWTQIKHPPSPELPPASKTELTPQLPPRALGADTSCATETHDYGRAWGLPSKHASPRCQAARVWLTHHCKPRIDRVKSNQLVSRKGLFKERMSEPMKEWGWGSVAGRDLTQESSCLILLVKQGRSGSEGLKGLSQGHTANVWWDWGESEAIWVQGCC